MPNTFPPSHKGQPNGLFSLSADQILEAPGDGAQFGQAMSHAGDLTEDGYDDVVIGAPFMGNGMVWESENGHIFPQFLLMKCILSVRVVCSCTCIQAVPSRANIYNYIRALAVTKMENGWGIPWQEVEM